MTSEISGLHYSNFVVSDAWPVIKNFEVVDFTTHTIDAEKIYSPHPTPEEISFIQQHLPHDLYSVLARDGDLSLLMIMHKDATKSKATAELARYWGIVPSEIVAFGDDLNDVDMLQFAGAGVAMGNAFDAVKAASDFVCRSNDAEGLAHWLAEHVL